MVATSTLENPSSILSRRLNVSDTNPYLHLIPKGQGPARYKEILDFRRRTILAGYQSKVHAANLWRMCSEDLLFWVNAFCYILEPRNKHARVLPFITRPYQDEALMDISGAIGNHDLVIEKSREMGASWMCLTVFTWWFLFRPYSSFALMSYKEDLVDKPGHPKALFQKVDHILNPKWYPSWLMPKIQRTHLHIKNLDNESVMNGESTTARSTTGDRVLALLLDEYSEMENAEEIARSAQHVTKSRLFNFTPEGPAHPSTKLANDPKFRKLSLHWSLDAEKMKGAYRDHIGKSRNGIIGWRSPWYDYECDRSMTDLDVARELDIDYAGSDCVFFHQELIARILPLCRPADYTMQVSKFIDWPRDDKNRDFWNRLEGSRIDLWAVPDKNGRLPTAPHVIGVDISEGMGSSNSAMVVYNRITRQKVMQFVWSRILSHELAHLTDAISKWFRDANGNTAFVIWEQNGPGSAYGQTLVYGLKCGNVYIRRDEEGLDQKQSDKPGWSPSKKYVAMENYRQALNEGKIINYSAAAVNECSQYLLSNGKVKHSAVVASTRQDDAEKNHGDIVIADMLAAWAMRNDADPNAQDSEVPIEIPQSCLAQRMQDLSRQAEFQDAY